MRLSVVCLVACLAFATAAQAATLTSVPVTGGTEAVFAAVPGEGNNIEVVQEGEFLAFNVFNMAGSASPLLTAMPPCTTDPPPNVPAGVQAGYCPSSDLIRVRVLLGDLNDFFDGIRAPDYYSYYVDAGPGNDALTGTYGNDELHGGSGNDRLHGGRAGDDLLDGGPGADAMAGGGSSNLGDTVTYASRTQPVTVTLDDRADDGEAGEGDNVASDVDNVIGGAGNDTIVGSDRPNKLDGGPGNDRIDARGGTGVDTITCGPGNDTALADDADLVNADCETVVRPSKPANPAPPTAPAADTLAPTFAVVFQRPSYAALTTRGISLTVRTSENAQFVAELQRAGQVLARARQAVIGRTQILLRLNAAGRAAARQTTLKASLVVTATDSAGNVRTLNTGVLVFGSGLTTIRALDDNVPPSFLTLCDKPLYPLLVKRGIGLTVTTSEPSTVVGELRSAGKLLGRVRGSVISRERLILRLNAAGRAAARAKTLRMRLLVTATDTAGNKQTIDAGVLTFR